MHHKSKKSILFIHQSLHIMGGIETRWVDEFKYLNKNNFQTYLFVDKNKLNDEFITIFQDTKILPIATKKLNKMSNFIDLVENLVDCIEHNAISHVSIHIMDMFGLAAVFAAQLTKRPTILTTHGVTEIYQQPINRILLQHLIKKSVGLQVYVSKLPQYIAFRKCGKTIIIPNLINIEQYDLNNKAAQGWLMISRISEEKYPSIMQAISLANHCNVAQIDIVGGGDTRALKQWILKQNYSIQVIFLGQSTDVHKLIHQYELIIGMGRAALEGIACKKQTCIITPDGKLKGLVTPERFIRFMDYNFTGNTLKTLSTDEFLKQHTTFTNDDATKIYQLVEKHLSTDQWDRYIKYYDNTEFVEDEALIALFHKISFFAKNISKPFDKDKLFLNLLAETIVEYNLHDTKELWNFYCKSDGLRVHYPNPYDTKKNNKIQSAIQKILRKYNNFRNKPNTL